jgi:DNA-binding response OmpR family regulator/HAMP domain-containing protein
VVAVAAHNRAHGNHVGQAAAAQAHQAVSHQFLLGSVFALGVMTLVSVLVGWVAAGRVLRPLRVMTAATRRISAESLHERLAMPGPGDELKDLADTIDGLLARLESAFAAQRRFVANASHELRTPLATMRASVDVAVAKPGPVPAATLALAGRLRTELDRVDGLLDGLLMLARAQHGALPGSDRGAGLGLSIVAAVAEAHGGTLSLSARAEGGLRVSGLSLGADDYLAKPFHFPELVLRIRALARRQPGARARTLRVAGIELDPVRRTVTRDGRQLGLSVKEFGVLEALLRASPGFLRAEDLLEQVWDEHADPFTNTVTVTAGRLRRKLGDPPVVVTQPGVGYRVNT